MENNPAPDIARIVYDDQPADVLRAALEAGGDVNAPMSYGRTPLMFVCHPDPWLERDPDLEKVRLLLEHGADVHAQNEDGETALFVYLMTNRVKSTVENKQSLARLQTWDQDSARIAELLLENGADPDRGDKHGYTPLTLCVELHHEPFFAEMLLEWGADPDLRDADGFTALLRAARFCQPIQSCVDECPPMLALLAQYTDSKLPPADTGETPIIDAINSGNQHAVRTLLAAGHSLTLTPPFAHLEPFVAVFANDLDRLAAALEAGHAVDTRNGRGTTLLMWASELGHGDIVRFLLDAGVDIDARETEDGYRHTALTKAVIGNQREVVKLLLKRGAKPIAGTQSLLAFALVLNSRFPGRGLYDDLCLYLWNCERDRSEITPEVVAAAGLKEPLRELMEQHKPVHLRDAVRTGDRELLARLLKKTQQKITGKHHCPDVLTDALRYGRREIFRYLLDYGINPDSRDSKEHVTPLILAAEQGDEESVWQLLEASADPELSEHWHYRFTARDAAYRANHRDIVSLLDEWIAEHAGRNETGAPT